MFAYKFKKSPLNTLIIVYTFVAFFAHLIPVLGIVLSGLILSSIFILDDTDAICFWCYSSCFMICFYYDSTFLPLLIVMLAIVVAHRFLLAIKNNNRQRIIFISALLVFTLICTIYGLCMTNFHLNSIMHALGLILAIAGICVLDNVDLKKIILVLSLGIVVSSVLSLISYGCGIMHLCPYMCGSTLRFSGYFSNVNSLAMCCGLCQACLLALFVAKQLNFKKWCWLLAVITIIGFATFSKTHLLLTAITYALVIGYLFVVSKNKKPFAKFSLLGIIVLAILLLLGWRYVLVMLDRFTATQFGDGLNGITTGRIDIWKSFLTNWTRNIGTILFGCGITIDRINARTPHSLYVSIICKFGIVGTIALITFVVLLFKLCNKNKHPASYLPIIIVMLNGLTEDITCSLYTCLPIIIALCFILKNKHFNKE